MQQPSAPTEDVVEGNHSEEASDSDPDSVSKPESCSDSGSHSESGSGSVTSLEESLIPPSKVTLSENPQDQTGVGRTSPQVPGPYP